MSPVILRNPHRSSAHFASPARAALGFHRGIPGYQPTPLRAVPELEEALRLSSMRVKVESSRFGLPAFKILGASWAVARAIGARLGRRLESWSELLAAAKPLKDFALVAATDGNHGRAVARIAKLLGLEARIFVPRAMSQERRTAIEGEGADVTVVDGDYDRAVHEAMAARGDQALLIADVMLEGSDPVPGWVIEGYSTLFFEIDTELEARELMPPNVVMVQIGVGALAAAVVRHFRAAETEAPLIIGVEPIKAACALESVRAGKPLSLQQSAQSAMAGLNCESPSLAAWSEMLHGIDLYVAIEDEWTFRAMRALEEAGVQAGESGAAGVGGLLALAAEKQPLLPREAHVLAIISEGATDSEAYARILQQSK